MLEMTKEYIKSVYNNKNKDNLYTTGEALYINQFKLIAFSKKTYYKHKLFFQIYSILPGSLYLIRDL